MNDRTPASQIVAGCLTTADKIRALVKAGYFRTEVAKLLGIRYQHVRVVLRRSGIEAGLKKVVALELDPVEIDVVDKPVHATSAQTLLLAGFKHLGSWTLAEGDGIELTVKAPAESGVYAFVADDTIKYIGVTQRTFHQRMYNYKRGYARQRTSARIKKLIRATLDLGAPVHILIACPKQSCDWQGLPVDVAAGLEFGLIKMIQPEWNMLGVKPLPAAK